MLRALCRGFAAWAGAAVVCSALGSPLLADDFDQRKLANWHQFRGPLATGEAPLADPPTEFGENKNLRWKASIDGYGSSTPIIWGDQVFILTSIDTGVVDPRLPKPEDQPERPFGITYPNTRYQFVVLCLDRGTGAERWRRVAVEKIPHEGHHGDNNFASASPTTDGQRLYAWFGSAGLFCYDLQGNLLWQRDLGEVEMRRSFGEGCSPVVHGNRLVIVRDSDGPSTIYVLDTATGEIVWQADRDETSTWATPLVVEHAGRVQVITNASHRVRSYDLADGTLIWECGGQVGNVTPSPVAADGVVYCMSGYSGSALYAISLDALGDVTGGGAIRWMKNSGTPYVPSPALADGKLYYTQSNNGILTCVDAANGEPLIERTRLPGVARVYASPLAAAGRLYLPGRDGQVLVLAQGAEFRVLASTRLDEGIDASPAAVGKQLFVRGARHVYCFESSP